MVLLQHNVCARDPLVSAAFYRPEMEYKHWIWINGRKREKKTCSNKNTTHTVEHHWLLFIDVVGLVSLSVGYSTSYFSIIQSIEEANDRSIDRISRHYTTLLNKMCSIFTWSFKDTHTHKRSRDNIKRRMKREKKKQYKAEHESITHSPM